MSLGSHARLLLLVGFVAACKSTADESAPIAQSGRGGAAGSAGTAGSGGAGGSQPSAGSGGQGGSAGASAGAGGAIGIDAGDMIDAGELSDASGLDASDEPAPDTGCLDNLTDYKVAGPFTYETASLDTDESGPFTAWIPNAPTGCALPVIYFAGGTGSTCDNYQSVLDHLASHGFIVACSENAAQHDDTHCVEVVDAVLDAYPEIAHPHAIGFAGHALGGGVAYLCTGRGEATWGAATSVAGFAMEPEVGTGSTNGNWMEAHAMIDSPMLIANGSEDALVSESWVRDGYEALSDTTEAYWYEASGAPHIPVPAAWMQEAAVAWFRWKLLGDNGACSYVHAMPDGDDWDLQEQQNAADCL